MFSSVERLRRPAAAREQVLLAVDRQMESILRCDDLGGHRSVVVIALHQPRGALRRGHAAISVILTGILGVLGHADPQLGTLELQRLDRVIADQGPFTVLRAVFLLLRYRRFDFVSRQVLRQRLARGLRP